MSSAIWFQDIYCPSLKDSLGFMGNVELVISLINLVIFIVFPKAFYVFFY